MARISNVSIPDDKQAATSLTYIYGIGPHHAAEILDKIGLDGTRRIKDLTDAELTKLRTIIDQDYTVEGDLQRIVTNNIKRLKEVGTYRGLRHKNNLPSRGQRTRTNARTRRGKKTTVGGTQKKAASKT